MRDPGDREGKSHPYAQEPLLASKGASPASRFLQLYYLATPLFMAADWFLGLPLRVAALDDLGLRWSYYGLLLVLALLIRWRPAVGPVVGLVESSVNLLLLLLSILLPIWAVLDGSGGEGGVALTPGKIWNVLLVGPILILSIKRSEWALTRARRR